MSLNLAEEFRLLDEDETWPWKYVPSQRGILRVNGHKLDGHDYLESPLREHKRARFITTPPLRRAQLALMVLNENRERTDMKTGALSYFGINPDHYENVKRRVEEAEAK